MKLGTCRLLHFLFFSSFIYEPILDMSDAHLRALYADATKLKKRRMARTNDVGPITRVEVIHTAKRMLSQPDLRGKKGAMKNPRSSEQDNRGY